MEGEPIIFWEASRAEFMELWPKWQAADMAYEIIGLRDPDKPYLISESAMIIDGRTDEVIAEWHWEPGK